MEGGSPCQGLSGANTTKKSSDDPRSKLFFEMIRFIKDLQQEKLEVYYLGENVASMDAKDQRIFSNTQARNLMWLMLAKFSRSEERGFTGSAGACPVRKKSSQRLPGRRPGSALRRRCHCPRDGQTRAGSGRELRISACLRLCWQSQRKRRPLSRRESALRHRTPIGAGGQTSGGILPINTNSNFALGIRGEMGSCVWPVLARGRS